MNLLGIGGGTIWQFRLQELEQFVRRVLRTPHRDPDAELPDVELPDGEQRAALNREAARRMVIESR